MWFQRGHKGVTSKCHVNVPMLIDISWQLDECRSMYAYVAVVSDGRGGEGRVGEEWSYLDGLEKGVASTPQVSKKYNWSMGIHRVFAFKTRMYTAKSALHVF